MMEKIQYSEGAVSEELDAQQETLDEVRAGEIGAALMRAMEIASMAVDEKKISLENLLTMISVFDGHQDNIDELNDEQRQKVEEAIKVYLNEVNNEKAWSEALSVLVPIGVVRRDEMISFLDGGMPIEIILNNEQYLDCFTENGTSFRRFPTGLLGRIYEEMSVTDDGKERFGELFIEDHKWILPWEIMFLMLWKVAKKLVRNKGRILRFFERWAETSCFQWRIRTTREVGETGKNEPSGRVMKNKSLRIVKPEGSFLTI